MPKDTHVIVEVVREDGQTQELARFPKHALTAVKMAERKLEDEGLPQDRKFSDTVVSIHPAGLPKPKRAPRKAAPKAKAKSRAKRAPRKAAAPAEPKAE